MSFLRYTRHTALLIVALGLLASPLKAQQQILGPKSSLFTRAGSGLTGVENGSSSFADVDEDGNLDLLIAGNDPSNLPHTTLYLGSGDGSFTSTAAGLADMQASSTSIQDVNGDGSVDILITGVKNPGLKAAAILYLGDGQGGFTKASAEFTGARDGSVSIGDVDNDGNPDILITGSNSGPLDSAVPTATLYLGDGTGNFSEASAGLEGVYDSSSSVGDVNGDGNLDLLITGENASDTPTATLYLGNGDGSFSAASVGLTGVSQSSSSIGDVNEDGNPDLLITGQNSDGDEVTTLYLGDGQGGFSPANAQLPVIVNGSSSFGDANGDGNLDLVLTGSGLGLEIVSALYLGDGTGNFSKTDAGLTGVDGSSSTFGDVDGDGDEDLVITGRDAVFQQRSARLYVNRSTQEAPNQSPRFVAGPDSTLPLAPGRTLARNFEAGDPDGDGVSIQLVQGSSVPGANLADDGNGIAKFSFTPSRSQAGKSISFTVEAADGNGKTATRTFTVNVADEFLALNDAGLDVFERGSASFGDFNEDGNLDLLLTGVSRRHATDVYIGNGQGGFTQANAGLKDFTDGSSSVGDVDKDGHLDVLLTGGTSTSDATVALYLGDGAGGFTEAGANLTGVTGGSTSMGDVNGDGNLDLLITGQDANFEDITTLYLGDGQGGFSKVEADFVDGGPSSMGDMDNDGNLDVLVAGRVYLGDGTGGFTKTGPDLSGIGVSSSSIGDVDNDGNLDFLITGDRGLFAPPLTTLYLGDGTGNFTKADAGLTGVHQSTSSFADIDADGTLDLLITGRNANDNEVAILYLGDGQGGFTRANAGLIPASRSTSAFGDVDGDADPDLVVAGNNSEFEFDRTTTFYENLHRNRSGEDDLMASAQKRVSGNGTVDFGDTGVDLTFTGTSGSGTVTVEKYGDPPADSSGIEEANISTYRFVITAAGGLSFDSSGVRLDVGTLSGIGDASNVTVYSRSAEGSGQFTALNTTFDADANELVATTGSFSEFVLASNSEPLPVEMAGFEGQVEEDKVRLTWQTASEMDNAGFAVQRRAGTKPKGSWEKIGFVESKASGGTTTEARSYHFTDANLPYEADRFTYRLKQVDTDGTAHYSKEVTVRRGVTEVKLLAPYPNPARGQATVRYAVPEKQVVTIRLYDVLGRRVRTVVSEKKEGRHEQRLDLSGLPSGTYFLRLKAGGQIRTQKLTVVR